MRNKFNIHLVSAIIFIWVQTEMQVMCNPIPFDPSSMIRFMPIQPQLPLTMDPQLDPYASMFQHQYLFPSPFGQLPFDANRRSLPITPVKSQKEKGKSKGNKNVEESDEQKALGDLPLSFLDPDPPSTISERISESFSAIGEGVKNHFKSVTENFSDTIDDIKDAWRSSDNTDRKG